MARTEPESIPVDMTPIYQVASLRPGERPSLDTLDGSVRMMADRAEAAVRTGGGIIRDPALNAYVSGLVCKLAGPYCPEIRTYIVRVPDFNASMMPNGTMQIWSGLLLRVRNEAQLVTVLGHEIGHYLQRHSQQRVKDILEKSNALIFIQMATAAAGIPAAGDLAALATYGSIAAFSREHETEADDIALRLLVLHGYDPREAPLIWDSILEELKADENYSRRSIFFASHPPPENRSDRLSRQAAFVFPNVAAADSGRERFRAAIAPHFMSFLQDELRLRRFERLETLLDQIAEDRQDFGDFMYAKGEFHRIRNRESDNDFAVAAYDEAIKRQKHPPELYRSLGQVLLRQNRRDDARVAFHKYLELVPTAPDRGLVESMLVGAGS